MNVSARQLNESRELGSSSPLPLLDATSLPPPPYLPLWSSLSSFLSLEEVLYGGVVTLSLKFPTNFYEDLCLVRIGDTRLGNK